MIFQNRNEAGKLLAQELIEYKNTDAVLYALPRGGVVVAYEIAKILHLPLDVVLTKKIGHPLDPEFAICAVSESGILECGVGSNGIDLEWLENEEKRLNELLKERRQIYKPDKIPAEGKTAILIDDGIATGLSMMAAVRETKQQNPSKIVVAVPVAPPEVAHGIGSKVDKFIALHIPDDFASGVGAYYIDFHQVEDSEVVKLLNRQIEMRTES